MKACFVTHCDLEKPAQIAELPRQMDILEVQTSL